MKLNLLLEIGFIVVTLGLFFARFRKKAGGRRNEDNDKYDIGKMVSELKEYMNNILCMQGGKKRYGRLYEKKEHLREELRLALRQCSCGDIAAKNYVKEHIKNWLQNDYGLDANNINRIISFNNVRNMKSCDKFDIILRRLKIKHNANAFSEFMQYIDPEKNVVTTEDINNIYSELAESLSFNDCLDIITQRIYQNYKGHGVIDELRDMNIDGISAGVSGLVSAESGIYSTENELHNYNSIWVFFKGRMIRMEFMGFGSEHELERVCKNIYRYMNPGQLSAAKGYMANEMKDGSRVIVVRPPFSESWAFFIRKFGMGMLRDINELVVGAGAELVIELIRLLILASQVFGITGEQGCGKTTMLKAAIAFIPDTYTIRVQELVYELHLRELYPKRNIVSFRETATVDGREGLDIQKKTDGTVSIIGEVASASVASWLVMASQVASKFTIFTHHAKSTEHLIYALRNDLMLAGGFNNETVAENQVRSAIRFDIHMARDISGKRYIERITQIIPEGQEKCRDIIVMKDNAYIVANGISKETFNEMNSRLDERERNILKRYEET